ncbi:MAG: hypothetical protein KC910_05680 [Candidatus Eremiobacteraeota bacterium]|nr:hypothetical protein [Candidatus Eremiobacteraeota bacterium]
MSPRRAFSLAEVLVAVGLALLLLTLLVGVLLPSLGAFRRTSSRVDMQQTALVSMRRIRHDLERSTPASVQVYASGGVCVLLIHRLKGLDASGAREWEPKVVIYHFNPASARLVRELWPNSGTASTSEPQHLEDATLAALASSVNPNQRVVAVGVDSFEVEAGNPLKLHLAMRRGEHHLSSQEEIYLRN